MSFRVVLADTISRPAASRTPPSPTPERRRPSSSLLLPPSTRKKWELGVLRSCSHSCRSVPLIGKSPGRVAPLSVSKGDGSVSDSSSFPSSDDGDAVEFITSERVKIVAMLASALALCNADRVVMSVAVLPMSSAYGWSRSFSGIVQSSFLWGYMLTPIVGGALVDQYGSKIVLGCGVALWSVSTFLTPWAAESSLLALLAMRVLLGMAEGVALPSMNKMILRWFPKTERSRAVALAMGGFHLGSAIGLIISPIIMSQTGVFGPFVMFGLFGFLWVLVWLSASSDSPDQHPQISKYELEHIKDRTPPQPMKEMSPMRRRGIPPFRLLLSKLPTWAIIISNAMHNWGYFVILSWMPIYFNTIYQVDLRRAAWFSALPWAMMATLGYVAGAMSDMLIRCGTSVTVTRKIMQSIGFIGPGLCLLGLNATRSPFLASAWLTAAVGLNSFSHAGFLVNLQEIAPQYAGVLHGMSNTAGTLAAIIGTIGAGYFVELMGSFRGFLYFTAVLYFVSALFWNIFSTGEQVIFNESDR
ncbi:putative anion transporter 4 [Nymphaea thermarum]|nr:putative anion transporter 4 [Nymphaea thermarum]